MSWFVWENTKLIRHSQDYYKWLLKVMDKRNADEITIRFGKNKFATFYRKNVMSNLKTI